MAEEKKGGVSVYISPEIVEGSSSATKKTMRLAWRLDWIRDDAGAVDRFTCTLLFTCGAWMHKNYGGE